MKNFSTDMFLMFFLVGDFSTEDLFGVGIFSYEKLSFDGTLFERGIF